MGASARSIGASYRGRDDPHDAAYTLTFGRYDPAIHRQSLIAAIALPVLLLAQRPRFFGKRGADAG